MHAGVLSDHFGVTLQLDPSNPYYDARQGNARSYPFLQSSFAPTLHADTVDYVVNDWHGSWSATALAQYTTIFGQYPSGEEPYDVEALYFDDDPWNYYMAVVTSVTPPPGIYESRYNNILVVAGDLAMDVGLNANHSTNDPFGYDYGVNINNEVRPASSSTDATSGGTAVGNMVYRTQNTDWYTGTPSGAVAAKGEYTNFDPRYTGFQGSGVGHAQASYTKYSFYDGGGNEIKETLWNTYLIEVVIPRRLLPVMTPGALFDISFSPGCRNDGNPTQGILRYPTPPDVDYADIPEPGALSLMVAGLIAGMIARKRRRPV